jgi:hypothetical protein
VGLSFEPIVRVRLIDIGFDGHSIRWAGLVVLVLGAGLLLILSHLSPPGCLDPLPVSSAFLRQPPGSDAVLIFFGRVRPVLSATRFASWLDTPTDWVGLHGMVRWIFDVVSLPFTLAVIGIGSIRLGRPLAESRGSQAKDRIIRSGAPPPDPPR